MYVLLFNRYELIQIINLPARTDRRREMERELARFDLLHDPRVTFFDALTFSTPEPFSRVGSKGAFHSHLQVLKEASEAGKSVLVLQDDCDFLPEVSTFSPQADTDIFYGGFEASNPDDLHKSCIIGAHCMGFSAKAARKAASYLTEYLTPSFPPDPEAAADPNFNPWIRPPIDGALVWFRRKHPELHTEFKLLSVQRSSRSDIGQNRFRDRVWGLHHFIQFERRLRRNLLKQKS